WGTGRRQGLSAHILQDEMRWPCEGNPEEECAYFLPRRRVVDMQGAVVHEGRASAVRAQGDQPTPLRGLARCYGQLAATTALEVVPLPAVQVFGALVLRVEHLIGPRDAVGPVLREGQRDLPVIGRRPPA